RIYAGVISNPAGGQLGWDFYRQHFDQVQAQGGAFTSRVVVGVSSTFCSPPMRDEVKDFFTAHPVPSAERSLKQSLDRMNACIDLKSQQSTQLAGWLQQQQGGAAAGSAAASR